MTGVTTRRGLSHQTHKHARSADGSDVTRAPQRRRARPEIANTILGLVPARLRSRRALILGPLALIALLGVMRLRGGDPPPPEPFVAISANELSIVAPRALGVGKDFEVTVRGELDPGATVTLLVETGYAHYRLDAEIKDGAAVFEIEAADGPAAGVVTLTALSGTQTGHSTIELIPGTAVDPLDLFLGPRTIEATNETATMIVVIAEDEFGNPVVDGTEVDVRVTRPDLEAEAFTIETDGLLAWSRIISGTLAGRSKVAVGVDDGRGKELDFLEVAGSPDPFLIELADPPVPADGRSLVRLRTTDLIDRFGNVLPDGVNVFADVAGPGGTRRLTSQVIKGIAEFTLEAPSRPGTESVVVTASGTISPPLLVAFGPMVTGFDVAANPDIDGIRLSVGPVVSTLGAYVPDGTPVIVTTEQGVMQHPTFNGEADVVIAPTSEPITVDVLGFERTLQVGGS